jgi:predicted dehydrogenase
VFVEKPLCRTEQELRAIKSAWCTGGSARHLASNLVLRAAPLYQWLREAIQAGELGEVYAFDGDYLYGRLHKITSGWRSTEDHYSVMLGGGVHLVDLMLWLTGERPQSVTASGNRISTRNTAFRFNDFMSATYRFPSGLVGRVTANFGSVHRHQHVVRVFGTRATFIYDDRGARLHDSREPESTAVPITFAPLPDSKGVLIPAFVDGISSGREPLLSLERELGTIAACVAADRAAADDAPREITYV